jgi:hypothetical protein
MKFFTRIVILLTVLFWLVPNKSLAQREKIDEMRAAFIAKNLELASAESEKFWPIYNELNDKRKAIKKNLRQSLKNYPATASDKEAEEIINLENKSATAEAELIKSYNEKLKAVIGAKKLARLKVLEEEFKIQVLKAAKEN